MTYEMVSLGEEDMLNQKIVSLREIEEEVIIKLEEIESEKHDGLIIGRKILLGDKIYHQILHIYYEARICPFCRIKDRLIKFEDHNHYENHFRTKKEKRHQNWHQRANPDEFVECECGSKYRHSGIARHKRTCPGAY